MQDGSPYSASTQLSPGTRLNGIYEIDHLIAAYRAQYGVKD